MRTSLVALALFASTFVAAPAAAQAHLSFGGMDLRLVRPALDSKGLLTIDGADILGANMLSFSLLLEGGFGLVPFDGFVNDESVPAMDARRTSRLVDVMFTGTLAVNYGIANLLVIGAQLPVAVLAGPNASVPGQWNEAGEGALQYQGLGGFVLHAKMRFTRPERDAIGLAASLEVELPTASPSELSGDSILALTPTLIAEWRPSREVRFALEVGYRLAIGEGATLRVGGRTEPVDQNGAARDPVLVPGIGTDVRYDDLVRFSAGVGWRIAEAAEIALEVHGTQIADQWGNARALSLESLLGIKIFVDRNSYLLLAGGAGIPTGGFQAPDAHALIGFVFEPSVGDRDGDGLRDDVDHCPDEPEDHDLFADEDGCPDLDDDRDGILDVDDACRMVPEDRDGDSDEDGCPEGGIGDRDGDTILDPDDSCPDEPEDRDGFEDEEGCPDPDNDHDTILDTDDLCPDDAEDPDGFEDGEGCPDPDNDQDRILDVDDLCPDVPERYNAIEDEDGCDDQGIIELGTGGIEMFEPIEFAYDSAEILPESFHILDAIAEVLSGNTEVLRVEVQGHADDRGNDDYNIALTRDRAASVVRGLADRGIAAERMQSGGYGERCPLQPGTSTEARDRNRRVEIVIRSRVGAPAFTEPPCSAGRDLMPD
jgi:OmpA-OmpF porin, OOP family